MVARKRYANMVRFTCFTSLFESKNVKEALMNFGLKIRNKR